MRNDAAPAHPEMETTVRTEDGELLRRYVQERDERAFGECVRRHVDLVYSAALRRLNGDAHSAADVTQQVFTALARQAASLSRGVVLPGWLYVTTRHLSANLVRAEQSRRAREQEAHTMNELHAAHPGTEWERLRPMLDEVMDELGEQDRRAILLRFFARQPFAEVGAGLQVSEDAARMRVDRALEKLRAALGRRGILSTGSALSVMLAQHAVLAAPAGLAGAATTAALGGATGAGAFAFMALTKFQLGLGAAILGSFAAGALVTHYAQRGSAADMPPLDRREASGPVDRAKVTVASTAGAGPTAVSRRGSGVAAGQVARGQLQAETAAALQTPSVPEKYFALISILQRLTSDNWREVLAGFGDERRLTGLAHSEAFEMFARRAGEVVGRDAVGHFLAVNNLASANQALMGWASKRPAEALPWLGREVESELRRSLLGAAIRGLALSEPDLAVRTLEEQPAKERGRYTGELVTSMLRAVGLDQTQGLVEGMIARAAQAGTLGEGYLKDVFRDYSLLRIQQSAASGTLRDTVSWINRHVGQPYVDHRVIAAATERLAPHNPEETFRWLEEVNTTLLRAGDQSTAGYRVLLDAWTRKEGGAAVDNWLRARTTHPHYDHLVYQYVAIVAGQDANRAGEWANSIRNASIRQGAQQIIQSRLAKRKS